MLIKLTHYISTLAIRVLQFLSYLFSFHFSNSAFPNLNFRKKKKKKKNLSLGDCKSMAGSPWASACPTPPPPVMLLFEVSLCVCCGYSFGLDFWVSNEWWFWVSNEQWLDGYLHFTDLGWCQNGFWYESVFYCVNTCHSVRELLSEWNFLLPCFFIVAVAVAFESSIIVAKGVC